MTFNKDHKIAQILGISLNSTCLAEVLKVINFRLKNEQKTVIVTPNPEFVVYAQSRPWFAKILNSADIAVSDGIGLIWAARILNQPKLVRVTGADIVEQLLKKANADCWQIGIVGARKGDIQERKRLSVGLFRKYPRVKIFILEETPDWQQKRFELVFACQGMGEQERWIQENLPTSEGLIYIGVGGSLDYLAGLVTRAPIWMRRIGLEWLYRLISQPWRIKRQLALIKFFWLVLTERKRKNKV